MADARRRQFDTVIVFRFDRFARSVRQLVMALEEFQSRGIEFISHEEALNTSTPHGQGHVHYHCRHGRTGAQRP